MLSTYLIFCTAVFLLGLHVDVCDQLLFRQAGESYVNVFTPGRLTIHFLAAFIPGVNVIHFVGMILYIRGML